CIHLARHDEDHSRRRRRDTGRDGAEEELMRRSSLTVGADDDELCAELTRHVDELLPSRSAAKERLDVNARVVSAGRADGVLELCRERARAVLEERCSRRVLVGVNASHARPEARRDADGLLEGAGGCVAEVGSNDNPSRALHASKPKGRARFEPWNLRRIPVKSASKPGEFAQTAEGCEA